MQDFTQTDRKPGDRRGSDHDHGIPQERRTRDRRQRARRVLDQGHEPERRSGGDRREEEQRRMERRQRGDRRSVPERLNRVSAILLPRLLDSTEPVPD